MLFCNIRISYDIRMSNDILIFQNCKCQNKIKNKKIQKIKILVNAFLIAFWWRSTTFWLFQFNTLKKENAYLRNMEHLISFDISRFRQSSPEFKIGDRLSSFCLSGISVSDFQTLKLFHVDILVSCTSCAIFDK